MNDEDDAADEEYCSSTSGRNTSDGSSMDDSQIGEEVINLMKIPLLNLDEANESDMDDYQIDVDVMNLMKIPLIDLDEVDVSTLLSL